MRFDLLGFVVLVVALFVVAFLQVGMALLTMYVMHRQYREKFEQSTYGEFDFDNFQKPAFGDLLVRLALIFLGPTLLIHVLEFVVVSVQIKRAPLLWGLLLVAVETAAIGAGFVYVVKLERQRAVLLTTVSAGVYLVLLWGVIFNKLI